MGGKKQETGQQELAQTASNGRNDWMLDPIAVQSLQETLRKHIARLHVVYQPGDGSLPQLKAITGFLLRLVGRMYWVTAGHCVQEVLQVESHEDAQVMKVELLDARERMEPGIPFADFFECLCPHPDVEVADVAVVRVPDRIRRLLDANPLAVALNEEHLRGAEVTEGDGLCLVGVPDDLHTTTCVERPGHVELSGSGAVACLPVRVSRALPRRDQDPAFWSNPCDKYHEVIIPPPSTGGPQSVVGMSGGPVFSLTREGDQGVRCLLVGVQSGWIEKSRVLRIVPIRALVLLIEILEGRITTRCGAQTRKGRHCMNRVSRSGSRCHLHTDAEQS